MSLAVVVSTFIFLTSQNSIEINGSIRDWRGQSLAQELVSCILHPPDP